MKVKFGEDGLCTCQKLVFDVCFNLGWEPSQFPRFEFWV